MSDTTTEDMEIAMDGDGILPFMLDAIITINGVNFRVVKETTTKPPEQNERRKVYTLVRCEP